MSTNEIVHPTVHDNGTPALNLIRECEKASMALGTALGMMRAMAPNARDYPNAGDWQRATDQHAARVDAVARVMNDVDTIWQKLLGM